MLFSSGHINSSHRLGILRNLHPTRATAFSYWWRLYLLDIFAWLPGCNSLPCCFHFSVQTALFTFPGLYGNHQQTLFFGGGVFLGLPLRHMEVPGLGVELELYTTATATWDLSHICNLDHSSRQHRILSPLSEAMDRALVLKDTSQVHYCCATMGTPSKCLKQKIHWLT